MLFASYIRRMYMKFMVRFILLFMFITRYFTMSLQGVLIYVTCNLNKPLRLSQPSQATRIKVISGAITLTIRISGNFTGYGHLLLLRRFGTKSDGAVKLIYVVYKVKQGDSLV